MTEKAAPSHAPAAQRAVPQAAASRARTPAATPMPAGHALGNQAALHAAAAARTTRAARRIIGHAFNAEGAHGAADPASGRQLIGNQVLQRAARLDDARSIHAGHAQPVQRQCAVCAGAHSARPLEGSSEEEQCPTCASTHAIQARANDDGAQRACASSDHSDGLDRHTASEVAAVRSGGGQPLAPAERDYFEPRFERDFSDVRLHTGERAARSAQALSARAYTVGHDVVFDRGQYAPDGAAGRSLLAHELTHVVQQRAGLRLKGGLGQAGDSYERQAEAVADRVAQGGSAVPLLHGLDRAGHAAPRGAPAIQRNGPTAHENESVSDFAGRVHTKAADRLTRNIAVLGEWADYVRTMQGFQLQAQLLTGMAVELATVAAPTPSGRQRFETFASTHNPAEQAFQGSMLDIDASYRERSNHFMSFLASKTQGYDTAPSFAEGMQVIAGDRSSESLGRSEHVAPDFRYDAYASTIRRFQAGEIGGCQTCHEINFAWQKTAERFGDPLPSGDMFAALGKGRALPGTPLFGGSGGAQLSAAERDALASFIDGGLGTTGQQGTSGAGTPAAVTAPSVTATPAASEPNPFVPDTPLPQGVEVPPPRTDLCGELPAAEDAERTPSLASWGPGSAIVADVVRRIDAVLVPLGPRGYRVLGRTYFDSLYNMTPEGMERVRDGIVARIGQRQRDYENLRSQIQAGDVPYEELCPIVDELMPSTNALVAAQALMDVRRWQWREKILTALELTLMALTFMFPPAAIVTVPAGAVLGLVRMSLGIDQRRQGRQWTLGTGGGVYSREQEAEAPGLVSRGNTNIVFGGISVALSGLSIFKFAQQAAANAKLLRALEEGAVITHAGLPGVRLLARRGLLMMVDDAGQVLGYGMIRNGQIYWTSLRVPYTPGAAGGAADVGGSALVPVGPQSLAPFGGGSTGLVPFGGGGPGALVPWRPLMALPRSPLLLPAAQYEDFSDLSYLMAPQPGSGIGEGVVWSVTPEGVVFATPPVRGIPIYAPEGATPPASFFAGRGQPRSWIMSGPLQEGYSPFDVFPGQSATTRTLPQVRSAGGSNLRGAAGEQYIAELSGGEREVALELPGGLNRRSDVISPTIAGGVNQEVKNYLRFMGVGNPAREVPLTSFMQTEINRDAMIMYYYRQQPVWVFTDAPPSADLIRALDDAGIPYIVMSDRLPTP